ncbi:MAG: hypothetical protein ABSB35_07670 [Bryobacteraceae bacterium]
MLCRKAIFVAAALTFVASGQTIQMVDGAFRVNGWKADLSNRGGDWSQILAVFAGAGDVPPMLGTYSVRNGTLVFEPRFPLSPGVRYRALFHAPGGLPIEAVFDGPASPAQSSTRVEHIYPSAEVLPSNVLKLYILFSAPMSRGEAWQHIYLLDEGGKTIQGAFVEIDQELWDPSYRRLTVLFDPGRIKRGLAPNQQMGLPVVEGKKYTLLIDRDFHDAHGAPLQEPFRKAFRGGPVDRVPPNPKQWRIGEPKAGTRDPLVVDFPKPLDYALLQRLLAVTPSTRGISSVDRNETEWRFTPSEPWRAGDYQLVVDTALEDLAGNHIGRAFDVDTFAKAPEPAPKGKVSLPFRIH